MQTQELEDYLTRTGHVGSYSDSQFNCFCDKPLTDLTNYPLSPSGTVDIQAQILRTQQAYTPTTTTTTTAVKPPLTQVKTKTASPLSLDLGDTDIMDGNLVSTDQIKPTSGRVSHTLAEVYTPTKVLTQAEIDQLNKTANEAQAKQDSGALDKNYVKGDPNIAIPGGTSTFGGGWLWLLLLAGAAYAVTSGKKTRTVEL